MKYSKTKGFQEKVYQVGSKKFKTQASALKYARKNKKSRIKVTTSSFRISSV